MFIFYFGKGVAVGMKQDESMDIDVGMRAPVVADFAFVVGVLTELASLDVAAPTSVALINWSYPPGETSVLLLQKGTP